MGWRDHPKELHIVNLVGPTLKPEGPWLRGNLHTHTTESDGRASPAETLACYRRLGYDFLALSDHDRITRVAPAEVPPGLTLLPAYEASHGPHVLCVGVDEMVPQGRSSQEILDGVREQGGLAILNHPNWGTRFCHWEQGALEGLTGYAGIEIYNAIIEVLEGSPLATDRWDLLLTAGHRVWGFANDDCHRPDGAGWGWVVAQAEGRTPEAVLAALRDGRFYSSSGVTVTRVKLHEGALVVESPDAERIRFVGRHGRMLALADAGRKETRFFWRGPLGASEPLDTGGPSLVARYPFQGDEGYMRCELVGAGGRMAWTQPIWVTDS